MKRREMKRQDKTRQEEMIRGNIRLKNKRRKRRKEKRIEEEVKDIRRGDKKSIRRMTGKDWKKEKIVRRKGKEERD